MPTLTVTNLTASRLPVNTYVGTLEPNATRDVDLTVNQLELSSQKLVSLANASLLSWSTRATDSSDDNQAEGVLGGARVVAGAGTPNSAFTGSPGDMYVDTDGGAGATLYVKESGTATDTGWVAK